MVQSVGRGKSGWGCTTGEQRKATWVILLAISRRYSKASYPTHRQLWLKSDVYPPPDLSRTTYQSWYQVRCHRAHLAGKITREFQVRILSLDALDATTHMPSDSPRHSDICQSSDQWHHPPFDSLRIKRTVRSLVLKLILKGGTRSNQRG